MTVLNCAFSSVSYVPKYADFGHTSTSKALLDDNCSTQQSLEESFERTVFDRGRMDSGNDRRATAKTVHTKSPQQDDYSWTARISQHTKCGQGRQALKVYEEMREYGLTPSSYTFVAALKACSSLRDLESAKRIHADVVASGLESAVFVGTMLVAVHAKCGSLVDARCVFEKMPHRDVVCWNAMILGYAQIKDGGEALLLYSRMQQEGVVRNDRTFVGALKACNSLTVTRTGNYGDGVALKKRCLAQIKAIHLDAVKSGFETDPYVGTMLVDVYAKCGSLVDARSVFENMPRRAVVSWNAMILGYAQREKGNEALHLYTRMQQEGMAPNDRTFVAALKACSSLAALVQGTKVEKKQCLEHVRAIHSDIANKGLVTDGFVSNMLVDVYAKCGSLLDARHIFENMPHRTVVSWTAMISGYAQLDEGRLALQLFARMQQEGVVPNDRTFIGALKACSDLCLEEGTEPDNIAARKQCLNEVRAIHSNIVRSGFESDLFVGTMLVDTYAKCRSLVDARQAFERMPHRDVVSWNAMILGYAQVDEGEEALQLYSRMQHEGVVANERTFVAALKACSSVVTVEEASQEGDRLDARKRCLDLARGIHSEVIKRGCEATVFVGTMLVDVYSKCGNIVEARRVFEKMPHRDAVSWNAMILGYAQAADGEEAMQLYARMQQGGVTPTDRTFVAALKACGVVVALDKGKEIHAQISKVGLELSDTFVQTALIAMYGKCGSMENAQQAFDALPARNVSQWNALIAGYAHQGDSELVFDLLQRMRQVGLQPDGITFLSILGVCSHVGLVDKGQKYFDAMSRDYGITPTIEHCNCMVDLLGRAGHLDKAMAMAGTIQSNVVVWKTVLGACRKWRNVKLGRQAFERAVRADKTDAAAYVLMSNIYAAAHMLEDAELIQKMRVRIGAWKKPGQSWWTDMGGVVHTFVVGDQAHPESQDIYAKVGHLIFEMKQKGYVPHLESVLRDIPDVEREEALCGHSEKLAIAYALLKTPEGTTIRIVKNLRVCEDCHRATAHISEIEKRTIICRDASRFHVFKDGKCSCGNYW